MEQQPGYGLLIVFAVLVLAIASRRAITHRSQVVTTVTAAGLAAVLVFDGLFDLSIVQGDWLAAGTALLYWNVHELVYRLRQSAPA